MSSSWQQVTIKDIAVVDWGNTNLTKKAFVPDGPFLGVSAAGCDGRMEHAEHKKNTPVLSAIGAQCGRMFLPQEDFTAIKNTITLTPLEGVTDPVFLYYLLTFVELPQRGAGQPFISKGDIQKFPVPLPPLEEQQRIVAILDKAFEGLDRAQENVKANLGDIAKLQDRVRSDELDYREPDREPVLLSDVTEIVSGLVDPREDDHADLMHLGAGNMISGSDQLVNIKTAKEEKLISSKYLFDETAVLYSKIRPNLRKVSRPKFQGLCSADVYPLTPHAERLDRNFLFHLLLSSDFTEYAISGSARAGMPKVNRKHLFGYSFDLPPLSAQKRIASTIDEVHKSCSQIGDATQKELGDLSDLRQSLLQKAFAGELT